MEHSNQFILDEYKDDILTNDIPTLRLVGNIESALYRYDAYNSEHIRVRRWLGGTLQIPWHVFTDPRVQFLIDLQQTCWLPKSERAYDLARLAKIWSLTI